MRVLVDIYGIKLPEKQSSFQNNSSKPSKPTPRVTILAQSN